MNVGYILSIQSSVSYGYVGNSAAVFALQRRGYETLAVHTVLFSNHTGYPTFHGPIIAAEDIDDILLGLDQRNIFTSTDAILAGYLGSQHIGEVIGSAVEKIRASNPQAIYCCDPVMGDREEGFYTPPEVRKHIRDVAVPSATIITPNLFELEYLSQRDHLRRIDDVIEAIDELHSCGPAIVLATSVVTDDTDGEKMRMIVSDSEQRWIVETPVVARKFTGSGDLTAAVFLSSYLESHSIGDAVSQTASVMYSVLKATDDLGRNELALIQAQDQLVEPNYRIEAFQY